MKRIDIIPFLQKNELTQNLSLEEIEALLPFVEIDEFDEGEMVFHEGDDSRDLYLVIKGTLTILKKMDDHFQQFGTIAEGQFFGEMAHLENEKRSASIKALESVQVLSIHLDKLQQAENQKTIYAKIVTQLAKKVSGNLRRTDQTLIDSLKEKLQIMQTHNQVSKTLIHIIVLMAFWFNLAEFATLFPTYRKTLDIVFTSTLLVLFATSAIYVIRSSGYPLSFYGLTVKGWFQNTIEAILYSIPFMVLIIILKWVLIHNVKLFEGVGLFGTLEKFKVTWPIIVIYTLLTPVQEVVARGCIQSSFRNFFQGPNRVFMAVLVSNLLFQVVHTTKDFWLALASLIFGFFWGFLFESQKSIVGVTVSHAIIGTWAFFIVDFNTLFDLARAAQGG